MPDREELFEALDDCLAALEVGVSLENALARYPGYAAELRPLLLAALAAGAASDLAPVPAGRQVDGRAQFLARAKALGSDDQSAAVAPVAGRGWWSRLRGWLGARPMAGISPLARATLTGLVVLAGLGTGTYGAVAASAASLPGDPLYGVKRTVESTQLLLAPDEQARTKLQAEFDQRRVSEVQALSSQHRQMAVDFTGTLISMEGAQRQNWVVSGVLVLVGNQAHVDGVPVPGALVRVQGVVQADGEVQAEQVAVLPHSTSVPELTATPTATNTEQTVESTATPVPHVAAPTATSTEAVGNPPSETEAPSTTLEPTEDHGGSSASETPEATESGGGGGASASETPQPTEGGDHGGGLTQTPEPTEGGDHGGVTQTPQSTEGGDHGGEVTPTQGSGSASPTPRPTEGGDHGGATWTPTNTATNGGGGGGASPSNTPRPTEGGGDHGGGGSSTGTPDN